MRLVAEVDGEAFVAEPGKLLIIGRDVNADVPVENSRVSRQHLRVSFEDGSWVFRDLSSANGTFLSGEPAKQGIISNGLALTLGGKGGTEKFFSLISSASQTKESPRTGRKGEETSPITLSIRVIV